MFSLAIISAMSILQSCSGMSVKPHKTSVTYGVSDTEKDNGKDSVKDFKTMYGKDAEFIDVTSVMSVSKTMNKKFLEKN